MSRGSAYGRPIVRIRPPTSATGVPSCRAIAWSTPDLRDGPRRIHPNSPTMFTPPCLRDLDATVVGQQLHRIERDARKELARSVALGQFKNNEDHPHLGWRSNLDPSADAFNLPNARLDSRHVLLAAKQRLIQNQPHAGAFLHVRPRSSSRRVESSMWFLSPPCWQAQPSRLSDAACGTSSSERACSPCSRWSWRWPQRHTVAHLVMRLS